jgi:hypothetical protein
MGRTGQTIYESIRLVAMSICASGAERLDTSPMEPSHTGDP